MATVPWIDEAALAKAHPRLFHYTRAPVLPAILKSGGLFATHYQRTNDRDEIRSLRQPLTERMVEQSLPLVRERLARGDTSLNLSEEELEQVMRGDAKTFFDIMVRVMPSAPHITCFSAHDAPHHIENGILTMWRLYGGDGEGVALGFNTEELVRASERIQQEMAIDTIYLDRVGYGLDDPEVKRRLDDAPSIPKIYATFLIAILERKSEIPEAELDDLLKFLVLCASTKHPDFEDEREVRLVVSKALKKTRKGRRRVGAEKWRLLLPYLEALEEVMIGPSVNQATLAKTAKRELRKAGFRDVIVKRSDTPYRQLKQVQRS